jgi:hypothetical protein
MISTSARAPGPRPMGYFEALLARAVLKRLRQRRQERVQNLPVAPLSGVGRPPRLRWGIADGIERVGRKKLAPSIDRA